MTTKIRDQILAVRATGETNMFDTKMVQVIADRLGFYELVIFLEDHKTEYTHFILTGEGVEESDEESDAEHMMLTMHNVGYRDFKGRVDITDPCYNRDVWCRMNSVEIAKGRYLCAVWKNDKPTDSFDRGRIFTIGIYLDGKVPEHETMEKIGQIGVDAGLAGFFYDKPDFTDKEWGDFCDRIGCGHVFIETDSFFSSSGYGDGMYPVYAAKNEAGEIVSLEIRFIDEDDEEDEE